VPHPSLPLGLHLNQAARIIGQAFDRALHEAGGSLPVWLVLLNLKVGRSANQRELADSVGIGAATLSHHLNAMERDGLITRTRDETNRRIHVVALTTAGEALFGRQRQAATAFDRKLNHDISGSQRDLLAGLLDRLVTNVGNGAQVAPPWAGTGRPGAGMHVGTPCQEASGPEGSTSNDTLSDLT